MKYRYRGVNKKRNTVTGFIEASNIDEAKYRLRNMDIRPYEVSKDIFNNGVQLKFNFGKAIDLKGLIVFTRQLSSLINAGVTVVMALQILAEQERR
ncbi:hypothetical protein EBQ90_00060, partial [bacterium]|nr:hypothetical protein [bacterium]